MSALAVSAILAAALLGGPVDLVDAPPPNTPREGFVALGSVRVHVGRGEIEVDGYFNMRGGFIEYLASSPGTKEHESLLALDCDPVDLNAACLLIGLEPGTPPASEVDLRAIEGPRVIMRLRYEVPYPDGTKRLRDIRAEDVILNGPMEWEMARCGFVYTGSGFIEDYVDEPEEGADSVSAIFDRPPKPSRAGKSGTHRNRRNRSSLRPSGRTRCLRTEPRGFHPASRAVPAFQCTHAPGGPGPKTRRTRR